MTGTNNPPPRSLCGTQKVAALLLSLDRELAQRILKHFDPNELRSIAKSAANLGSVPGSTIEALIEEFLEKLAGGAELTGSLARTEELLSGAAPAEQVSEIMTELLGKSNDAVWTRLSAVPEATLAAYLAKEHPQTIATVAMKVQSSMAAKFLVLLPVELRNEVMRRMLTSSPVSDRALRMLETVLQEDVIGVGVAASLNVKVASIVNQMERDQINELLESIGQAEPAIAEDLKSFLFSFEDIGRLSPRARAILLDQVPTERLIAALRGADSSVRDSVLPALSARMRRMVELELSSGEGPSRKEILAAQRAIADTVLQLAESGAIELGRTDNAEAA